MLANYMVLKCMNYDHIANQRQIFLKLEFVQRPVEEKGVDFFCEINVFPLSERMRDFRSLGTFECQLQGWLTSSGKKLSPVIRHKYAKTLVFNLINLERFSAWFSFSHPPHTHTHAHTQSPR